MNASSPLDLDAVRDCLDSAIPCSLVTASADGTPNVTYVSHAEYIDPEHLALTFQFFNKTRENILADPQAVLYISGSHTGASYRLQLQYLRTDSEGPLFERMRVRLAGIASHTGMTGVFHLRGADIYRVRAIEPVVGTIAQPRPPRRNLLAALRQTSQRIAATTSFDSLIDTTLQSLASAFGIEHAMLLMHDVPNARLYTVGTHGYTESGVGSEIALGEGVIGVAAEHRVPIRLSYASHEYAYGRLLRETAERGGLQNLLQTEIPFPGLADANSQLATPIVCGDRLLGVLYVESVTQCRFDYDDEDALTALAAQLSFALEGWQSDDSDSEPLPDLSTPTRTEPHKPGANVRRYAEDDSIFIDEQYLIKGVAGAILWKLLRDHQADGRRDFTNRELRLDPSLRLPDIADNLEARLALLNRRLGERCNFLRLAKTGRGRFRLDIDCPIRLSEIARLAG